MIPVGGMVVSTAMVTAGLALQRTVDVVVDQRPRIEARLALGLSAREAFLEPYRTAMRTALVPAVDTTKVVGLISLPGAMTGLILAGVDPWDAIRYQIVVMYMLLGAAFMAAVLSARLAQRSLFDDAERLVRLRDCRSAARSHALEPGVPGSRARQAGPEDCHTSALEARQDQRQRATLLQARGARRWRWSRIAQVARRNRCRP